MHFNLPPKKTIEYKKYKSALISENKTILSCYM